jgi:uncharacterized cupredoxin-like copper-binding protein
MSHKLFVAAAASLGFAALAIQPGILPAALAHDAHEDHAGHMHHEGHANPTFAAGEPGAPDLASRTVEIVLRDADGAMTYAPAALDVKPGDQIRFVLTNAGELDHEFLIDTAANNAAHKDAMAADPDMQHAEPNGRRLKPGDRAELLWRFTTPGTFEIACLIPGHYEAGMHGTITVR